MKGKRERERGGRGLMNYYYLLCKFYVFLTSLAGPPLPHDSGFHLYVSFALSVPLVPVSQVK